MHFQFFFNVSSIFLLYEMVWSDMRCSRMQWRIEGAQYGPPEAVLLHPGHVPGLSVVKGWTRARLEKRQKT